MQKHNRLWTGLLLLGLAALFFSCAAAEEGLLSGMLNGFFRRETYSVSEEALALARTSGLPVLWLTVDTGEDPGEEDSGGTLAVLIAHGGALRQDVLRMEINLRGNTSKRFPKKSYRIKTVDDKGEKLNYSLAGLRSDDDWILNPMYTDTSKIREALSYEIWDMMNSSGAAAASSRVAYAEVFLNGEYWGIYGVQERIDRKQVSGDKAQSVLYKVIGNQRPTVEELLDSQGATYCQGIQLEYAGDEVEDAWLPAASYMALLEGKDNPSLAALSLENAIDYGLWAMLTQAHDCHFKNQFIHAAPHRGSWVMYKIPWDLNNTLGDIYQNSAADTNYTNYHVGELVMDAVFETLISTGDAEILQAIVERWAVLRSSAITEDKLIARAQALYWPLFDAIERDALRWPQSGMGNGNAANIRDVEDFFREILPRMDAYVYSLIKGT